MILTHDRRQSDKNNFICLACLHRVKAEGLDPIKCPKCPSWMHTNQPKDSGKEKGEA